MTRRTQRLGKSTHRALSSFLSFITRSAPLFGVSQKNIPEGNIISGEEQREDSWGLFSFIPQWCSTPDQAATAGAFLSPSFWLPLFFFLFPQEEWFLLLSWCFLEVFRCKNTYMTNEPSLSHTAKSNPYHADMARWLPLIPQCWNPPSDCSERVDSFPKTAPRRAVTEIQATVW